jgi:Tfp pilus assembly protein PilZ
MPLSTGERRYPRIGLPSGIRVTWQGSRGRLVSRVATLGLGGLFIEANDPPRVGDHIQLAFLVPDGQVGARAIVRLSHPGKGMGVEFTTMSHEARGRLQHLIQTLIGVGVSPNTPRSANQTKIGADS